MQQPLLVILIHSPPRLWCSWIVITEDQMMLRYWTDNTLTFTEIRCNSLSRTGLGYSCKAVFTVMMCHFLCHCPWQLTIRAVALNMVGRTPQEVTKYIWEVGNKNIGTIGGKTFLFFWNCFYLIVKYWIILLLRASKKLFKWNNRRRKQHFWVELLTTKVCNPWQLVASRRELQLTNIFTKVNLPFIFSINHLA